MKTIARASFSKRYLVHEKCSTAFLKETEKHHKTDSDFLGVHIHDARSEYLGRFPVCSHCGKSITIETIPDNPLGYAIKANNGGYLATQGNEAWLQDEPNGWALFAKEEDARNVAEPHHSFTGGFQIVAL
jgi:hypothetical protein